jgi:hypothetical protein
MKNILTTFVLAFLLGLQSCKSTNDATVEEELIPKTPVEVVSVSSGSIQNELAFFGNTSYLQRNVVTASIASFITRVNVKLGDKVKKGQLLYVLETKESRALGRNIAQIDSSLANFGIIKVIASSSGIISTLDKQQPGDYVLEGTQLCTITESKDLVFQVNVPYEYAQYARIGQSCTITLPDNKSYTAVFTKTLVGMNINAQTQTMLARTNQSLILPENMIVKVFVNLKANAGRQTLPRSAVLSDEMMREYWVMKLINDSTAIKIPVQTGNKNSDNIEIIAPTFSSTDRIISVGNYGLSDTALVKINSKK